MASERGEFIVLQTLDPVETGQEFRSIPPHMTVLSWFAMERSGLDVLIPAIDDLAESYGLEAATGFGTKRVSYGINKDIPACLVDVPNLVIHYTLRGFVDTIGVSYKFPKFAHKLSRHITDEQGVSIQPGDTVNFSSLALFSRKDDDTGKRKVVEHSAALGEHHETAP